VVLASIIYLQRVDDLESTIYCLRRRNYLEISGFVKEGGISSERRLGIDNSKGYVYDSTCKDHLLPLLDDSMNGTVRAKVNTRYLSLENGACAHDSTKNTFTVAVLSEFAQPCPNGCDFELWLSSLELA
jgi:hypothetical protein